jgi:hypothetical protein
VRDFIRREAALSDQVDRLEQIHADVIAEAGTTAIDTTSLPQFLARTFRALGDARQRQIEMEFSVILTAREAPLHNEIAALRNESAVLQNESAVLQNEFAVRQNEFAVLQNEFALLQNEFALLQNEFAALQNKVRAKDVEFQAYRDWVAPRNLPRRIAHKLRRMLLRR